MAWIQLTRFDKPIGTELLLYPTLWALCLSNLDTNPHHPSFPSMKLVLIFTLGAILMRAAGCAINDFADRHVDGQVERTKSRPLADGRLSAMTALMTFVILSLLAAGLLFFLPLNVFYWSLGAVFLAFIYPFMKRHTHLPQVVLAMAFGWAVPMAYVATTDKVDVWGWLLFLAYMCWTVAYDTQYAMCDREDDLRAGIKSTAILFGRHDVLIIMLLQACFLMLMMVLLLHYFHHVLIVLGIIPALIMIVKQYHKIKHRERLSCFAAFLDNAWIGRYFLLLIMVGIIIKKMYT